MKMLPRLLFAMALSVLPSGLPLPVAAGQNAGDRPGDRPNILWLTCEDISPHLGCYGDPYAITPNLDRLAAKGIRYTNAFAVNGQCAPSRSCLITGVYPWSLGSQHMRSSVRLPEAVKCFPYYLRQAGYYCTNNSKEDYNFVTPPDVWDESSGQAHWRKRRPDQPFFSVFNHTGTHESRLFVHKSGSGLPPDQRRDPARANIPPYHPDTPAGRADWAEYANVITLMDNWVASRLEELEQAGLADDTIVFFFSDHGVGLPRGKYLLYDSGVRVPLIIHFPDKYRHLAPRGPGSVCAGLVSFSDFAPTVLSLAGVSLPPHLQGRAFLGPAKTEPREHVFVGRDRAGTYGTDAIRGVRDVRYKYLRNDMTYRPYNRLTWYTMRQNSLRELYRLADEHNVPPAAELFMGLRPRPLEELYDLQNDPHELRNLAESAEHQAVVERLRRALTEHRRTVRDVGLMPEWEMHSRIPDAAPYDVARRDRTTFPLDRILDVLERFRQGSEAAAELRALTQSGDAALRYWAVIGLANLHDEAPTTLAVLRQRLEDESVDVRLAAGEALCQLGYHAETLPVLAAALQHEDGWVQTRTLVLVDQLKEKALPLQSAVQNMRIAGGDVKAMLPHVLRGMQPQTPEDR